MTADNCVGGSIRLVNGSNESGRVETFVDEAAGGQYVMMAGTAMMLYQRADNWDWIQKEQSQPEELILVKEVDLFIQHKLIVTN